MSIEGPAVAIRVASAVAVTAAAVSGAVVVALVLFYALEVSAPQPHVFGPISDMGTATWDLVGVPVFWGIGTALGGRLLRIVSAVTVCVSVVGALAGMLLVERTLPFAVSTPISVLALLVQCAWLLLAGGAMRSAGGWSRATVRAARLIPSGVLVGVVVVGASLAFGWGSPVQLVVMVVGLVPGLAGWFGWPVWFGLLARDLARPRPMPDPSGERSDRGAAVA